MKERSGAYLLAATAVFFWSTIATAFKIALNELSVVTMLGIATFVSTAVLFIIVILTGKLRQMATLKVSDLAYSAVLGLINPLAYYLILLTAYSRLPGQVAQPVNMIWPIILVFLSVPLLHQKIPARSFIALFVSLTGVYLIASQGEPLHPGKSDTPALLMALFSGFLWALYFILNMRDRRDEAVKLFTGFLFGSVYMFVIMLLNGSFSEQWSMKGTAAAVYCGLFEMGITFWLWLRALQLAPTTDRISNLVYFAPFLSLVLLHIIINEPVYYTTLIGLLLISGSVIYQNRIKPGKP